MDDELMDGIANAFETLRKVLQYVIGAPFVLIFVALGWPYMLCVWVYDDVSEGLGITVGILLNSIWITGLVIYVIGRFSQP